MWLIFLSGWWLLWGLSVAVNSSVMGREAQVPGTPAVLYGMSWGLLQSLWKPWDKQSAAVPSLFTTCAAFWDPLLFPMSCMTTLCQFSCSFSLCLLSAPLGWSCPLLLSFHSQSPGSDTEETSFPPISHQEVPRLCSGNPATWKLHPQQAQPAFGFSFRGACMDSKPFSFSWTPWCAAVCAAPVLGRCPVPARSQACCGWCSPYLPAQTHVRGREISEKKIRR